MNNSKRKVKIYIKDGVSHKESLTPTDVDKTGIVYVYNFGWQPIGWHPYRQDCTWGFPALDQPIGLLEFYRMTGVTP